MIKVFVEPPLDNNNYLVIDDDSRDTVLIDCSASDERIIDLIEHENLRLKYILLTHAHFDHVLGVTYFQEKYDIPVYLHPADFPLLSDLNDWLDRMGYPRASVPIVSDLLAVQSSLTLGRQKFQVLSTPGHTPGCVCYLLGSHLFSGDTLFKDTHGRTDLPGSNSEQMTDSLKRLFQLPSEISVYPGHGPATIMAAEKKNYPF
ncbi:MAG: MBL fold metallo-hydrolase [Alphaproteobacteria bacterium]|nr:MBL fold metallo-hydrolase [Alphaproteobacteria bacterium]